jgi:hypothetical protein
VTIDTINTTKRLRVPVGGLCSRGACPRVPFAPVVSLTITNITNRSNRSNIITIITFIINITFNTINSTNTTVNVNKRFLIRSGRRPTPNKPEKMVIKNLNTQKRYHT